MSLAWKPTRGRDDLRVRVHFRASPGVGGQLGHVETGCDGGESAHGQIAARHKLYRSVCPCSSRVCRPRDRTRCTGIEDGTRSWCSRHCSAERLGSHDQQGGKRECVARDHLAPKAKSFAVDCETKAVRLRSSDCFVGCQKGVWNVAGQVRIGQMLSTVKDRLCVDTTAAAGGQSQVKMLSARGSMMAPEPAITRLDIGSLCGWISLAAWIVVFSPQIVECYRIKSGEGLSLAFLIIWLTGDITGLIGAYEQGLLPTIIFLAVYYTLCDVVLIVQLFWYRRRRRLHPEHYLPTDPQAYIEPTETSPLLRRSSHAAPAATTEPDALADDKRPTSSQPRHVARTIGLYLLALLAVILAGVVMWILSRQAGMNRVPGQHRQPREVWDTQAQIFGWLSAAAYLGSRLPQIYHNVETGCEGLSLAFFCFSLLGNITYVGSILIPSLDANHLWVNLSWLVGSAGTILLDFVVLSQFFIYRKRRLALMIDETKP
ncbi:uncharacterized protein L969DRAFT_79124 [Mixia osmundae IAM 14324]|uniref:PQ-loop-domain-containing protein n=1 Tax=Mixia osmundae (strain CBS 9802 / IAM 14324 / JCM 22182 / KY 12970) TaxID=764103 RepID=G7E254_MIXOS|nr:uncharacterized protein L969DRAFT_79124 [Mixia osmundae IAM 14324]KEI36786.1 hypothetical protein L969DRAFT_79124 [Mixia osmundae IAM 14324]GAA96914.1 hypothetical protein E5Q_03588 [Mixia osmundae IAM 14324]